MTILHLESATKVCSVALTQGEQILALQESKEGNRHSQWMTSYIEQVLLDSELSYTDLDAIAIGKGPGSYTGLRVAYSVAKGLAYSLGIKIIEVDTLSSIARAYIDDNASTEKNYVVLPMIDARRMEVYMKALDPTEKEVLPLEAHILEDDSFDQFADYDQIVCIGDGAHKVANLSLPPAIQEKLLIDTNYECSAAHLRYEAIELYQNEVFADVAYCVPSYLKSPNITTPRKKILG